jgi:hypothetical protein
MFRRSLFFATFAQTSLVIFLLAGSAFAQAPNDAGSSPKEGDKCKVTAGTNKGQVGKYTTGTKYCEGSWGGTECANSDGTSNCAPGRTIPPFTGPEITMWQGFAQASSPGSKPGALHAWETKYGASVIKNKENQVVVKFPDKTVKFDCKSDCVAELFKK